MGIVYLSMMPESPRYLVSKKRFSEARAVFKWMGIKNGISEDEANQRINKIQFEGEKITDEGNDEKE